MSDRFRNDRRMEADRLFAAWLRAVDMPESELIHRSREEIAELRRRAESSGIQIPRTSPGFLYHGTSLARASLIRLQGLVPGAKSGWTGDGFAGHVQGRVFFCDTVAKASFYAREMSRARPCILRISTRDLADRVEDPLDTDGSFFVSRPVPAEHLEIWKRNGWAKLPPPQLGMREAPEDPEELPAP